MFCASNTVSVNTSLTEVWKPEDNFSVRKWLVESDPLFIGGKMQVCFLSEKRERIYEYLEKFPLFFNLVNLRATSLYSKS